MSRGGRLALFLLLATVGALFSAGTTWNMLEAQWRDRQFALLRTLDRSPADDTLRIVGIDETDLAAIGAPVALLHAPLGAFLEAMASARPRALGLDVLLPARSYDALVPGLDARLARGLLLARRATVLVIGQGADPEGGARPLHAPFATLAGADGIGSVLVHNDADGVVRRFDERFGGPHPLPTLAGRIARRLDLPLRSGPIDFRRGEPYAYTPLRDVLAWAAAGDEAALRSRFGDKIVLLGSVLAFEDLHRAPLPLAAWSADPERSPGVLLHAQILRSLLHDAILREPPRWAAPLAVALAAGFCLLAPGLLAWTAAAASAVLLLLGGLWLLDAGWAVASLGPSLAVPFALAARTAIDGWHSARERRRLRTAFGGAVSPAVLDEILAGRLVPAAGGVRREICVLFSDIRGFTSLSEDRAPEAVTSMLNAYFARMSHIVHAHGGTVDKFIGDGLMAFFGAPQPSAAPCVDAFAAARAMLVALREFNAARVADGEAAIAIGIGLHCGPAVVGFIGSPERHEYSAIGDTVNAASRIEGLTKATGFPLLVSAAVAAALPAAERSLVQDVGALPVKGRSDIVVFGWDIDSREGET